MKEFRKEDIKLGMVLKLRNGDIGLVVKYFKFNYDWILIGKDDLILNSNWLDDDLLDIDTYSGRAGERDVVAIYTTPPSFMLSLSNLTLIWERPKLKEYTMDELYEIVGHKFQIKE